MGRPQLYRDPENGKIKGVCAGVAAYFGMEVWLVRVVAVSALLLGMGFFAVVAYIAFSLILDPMPEAKQAQHQRFKTHAVKEKSWQAGSSATQVLAQVGDDLDLMEHKVRGLEAYVTSSAFKVDREFSRL